MFQNVVDAWSSFAIQPWNALSFGVPQSPVPRAPQGNFTTGYFHSDARTLRYKLFVPSSYRGEPMPLVVMLHGCGQDAADFARGTGMNELAERVQCLVLYPEQSTAASWNRCWNWYEEAHHQRGQGEPALIAGLTQQVASEYAVDRTRISVAGLSSGGAMAVILGRTYPDVFTAVGCHSGLAHGSATDSFGALLAMRDGAAPASLAQAKPLASGPIIVFHGDADGTVHRNNSTEVVLQSIEGHAAQAPGGREGMAMQEETGKTRGRGFTRQVHHGRKGDVVAEHWTVHGAGHAWSGGDLQGSYTDTQGPDASEEMLRFFLQR